MLLIFAVFFLHGAWPVPDVNETHYLSKAKHYWNPDWCRHDFFLNTPDAHEVFCWSFGWVTKWLTMDATAWLGRLLTWALLAWSWRRLSWAMLPRNWLAVLSAALFVALNENAHMAGEWVVGGVEAKGFSYVLVFLGFEAVTARPLESSLAVARTCFGNACDCGGVVDRCRRRGLVGVESRRATDVALDVARPDRRIRVGTTGLVVCGGASRGVDPQIAAEANQIYVCAPATPSNGRPIQGRFSQPAPDVVGRVAVAADSRENRRCRTPVPLDCEHGNFADAHRLWVCVFVALESDLGQCACCGFTGSACPTRGVPMGVALIGLRFWRQLAESRPRAGRLWMAGIILAMAINLAAQGSHLPLDMVWSGAPPVVPRSDKSMVYADWRDVCKWAGEHTTADALFITPRMACTFRWYAGRGEVVTWKDIPQNAAGIVAWWGRLTDLFAVGFTGGTGQPPTHWVESLAQVGPKRLADLARNITPIT